jgi:hypothetical protein
MTEQENYEKCEELITETILPWATNAWESIRNPTREELTMATLWTAETIKTMGRMLCQEMANGDKDSANPEGALMKCDSELDVLLSQLPKEEQIWVEEERMQKEILRILLGILKTQLWMVFKRVDWRRQKLAHLIWMTAEQDERLWRDVYLRKVKREACLRLEKLNQSKLPEINERLEVWTASPEEWEREFRAKNVQLWEVQKEILEDLKAKIERTLKLIRTLL